MSVDSFIHRSTFSGSNRGPRARTFLRHVLEMTIAMMLGMGVLGVAFREIHVALFGTGFDNAWHHHTELAVFAMTFNMTVPMVLWMRYRGHRWQRGGEMAAAMNLPVLPLLLLYWLGPIPSQGVLGLQMMLMLPAMLAAMLYRKEEYSGPHHGHPRRRWFVHAH